MATFLRALLLVIMLSGCSMAPKYVRPDAPVEQNWPVAAMADVASLKSDAGIDIQMTNIGWRTFFVDQHLQKLIEIAIANNRDLRVACLNIARARGTYQVQRADQLPGLDATAQSSNQKTKSSSTGIASVSHTQTANVNIPSFELDFFGRIQSLKDKALEEYLSTEEALKSAQITLVSEVAKAYLTLVADKEMLAISSDTLTSQQASYDIIKRRYELGVSSELDLRQAQISVDTARVDIAHYNGQIAQDITALTLLAGTPLSPDMLPARSLNDMSSLGDVPVGLPSQILLGRPDVMQAEHQLKAANANIGAARASFFPSISLTAAYGISSSALAGLFDGGTGLWSFMPKVDIPLFQGGKNMANLRVSETDKSIAVANYEKAIQTAFREVSDALILRKSLLDQCIAQQSLTEASSAAYRLSLERYHMGIDSYLSVLVSQRTMYSSRINLVSSYLSREVNFVQLYKSVGGGWNE
ncbi:MAG: efflux transporter outer membrane subunit [Desulfovibrio desulfuricans]|nr:efflux transporter outer membrane subunit [Desulfovibrio desulfuricans]